MYRPAAFDVDDPEVLRAAIEVAGPAHLVTVNRTDEGTIAMQSSVVPLLVDRAENTLVGHLARPNPQWRSLAPGVEALAIFAGPDAYVSPSAYATKRETGRVVPKSVCNCGWMPA